MVNEKCLCVCGQEYNKTYGSRHLASKAHLKATGGEKPTLEETKKPVEETGVEQSDSDSDSDDDSVASGGTINSDESDKSDDFLGDLGNDVWVSPEEQEKMLKEEKKRELEMEKMRKDQNRRMLDHQKLQQARAKLERESKKKENALTHDDIQLLGRERHELIRRIAQYKTEFKTESKGIKIPKKNITVEILQKIIGECECILDLGGAQAFVMDGLFQTMKVVECVSSVTQNYDISGLADCLRKDPHFNSLCRRLYIRYGSFSQIDPLYQATFIVITTAYVMRQKNIQKKTFNAFLEEPIARPVVPPPANTSV